ncbi:phosphate transport system permease protein PstA [Bombiscardovia apis]|uniref:Phosphate transport system permease protein PstA n=1 Tax=Bombiscardovia apis TaxID=2932182 RepID=A0ABM8BBL6_9BIFI|nr:phosphate transport system permease protein PstA [Bombiscardovia apis]
MSAAATKSANSSSSASGSNGSIGSVGSVSLASAQGHTSAQLAAKPVIDFDRFRPTRSSIRARKRRNALMTGLIALSFVVALIPLISVLWVSLSKGLKRLNWDFLTHNMSGVVGGNPTATGGHGGILHAIIGTLEVTAGAMIISVPIGVMCAVFLVEYASGGRMARAISLLVDVMSGIPSIVAGLFAFSMFAALVGPSTVNGFSGSVALSLLMIPTVVKTSEDMLRIVPGDLREAAYALGVTKQRTITKIVLRTALPGIVSGVILAIARVIGETAPLLIASGFIASTNPNLFSGRMTTLPVYVYNEYSQGLAVCGPGSPAGCVAGIRMERAWAAALALIVVVLVLNLLGRLVSKVFSVQEK